MRIELNAGGLGRSTVNDFQDHLNRLISEADNNAQAFDTVKNAVYNLNGGVANMQHTMDLLQARETQEEERRQFLEDVAKQYSEFLRTAYSVDNSVAALFEAPERRIGKRSPWLGGGIISDFLNSQPVAYYSETGDGKSETDLSKMSLDELEEFGTQLEEKYKNGELSDEDRNRINALLEHLSHVEITEKMSEDDQRRVKLFNRMYAISSDKCKKETETMKSFFENNVSDSVPENERWTEYEKEALSYLVYTSDNPQHDLVIEYIGDCEIAEFNASGCYYSPDDQKIHLNRNGWTNISAYHGVFEEIGHNIDDRINGTNDGSLESIDGTYAARWDEAMKTDVSNLMWKQIDHYDYYTGWKIDGPGKQRLHDVLMGKAKYKDLNPRLQIAYDEIYAHTFGKLNPKRNTISKDFLGIHQEKIASDPVVSTLTQKDFVSSQDPKVLVNAGHPWTYRNPLEYMHNLAFQHDDTTKYPEEYDRTEVFSQYVANGICCPNDYKADRELFPETYNVMDEMVGHYLKE